MTFHARLCAIAAAGAILLAGPLSAAEVAAPLIEKLGSAGLVLMQNKGVTSVALPMPVGPKNMIPGAPPDQVRRLLAEKLTSYGAKIDDKSPWQLQVRYDTTLDDRQNIQKLEVNVRLDGGVGKLVQIQPLVFQDKEFLTRLKTSDDPLNDSAIPELARKLAELLATQKARAVWVQPFTGAGAAATGVVHGLCKCLQAGPQKPKIEETADYQVTGTIRMEPAEGEDQKSPRRVRLLLEATLLAGKWGKQAGTVTAEATLHLQPKKGPGIVQYAVVSAANQVFTAVDYSRPSQTSPVGPEEKTSEVVVENGVVRPTQQALYGISVAVQQKTSAVELKSGTPFVTFAEKDVYTIRLHNRARRDAVVALTIDGLSFNHLEDDGQARPKMILVKAGSVAEVPGWYKSRTVAHQFSVMSYSPGVQSAAPGRTQGKVGAITAVFHHAYLGNEAAEPDDEIKGDEAETKIGEPIGQNVELLERRIGRARAAVSIRYGLARR